MKRPCYLCINSENLEKIEDGNLIGTINSTVVVDAQLVTGKNGLALYINGYINNQHANFGNYTGNGLGISSCVLAAV